MKTSLSSTTCCILLLLFFFLLSSVNCRVPSSTSSDNTHNHNHQIHHCDSFTKINPRSLCNQLQRSHQRLGKIIPPSHKNEIDPRYGAEKRLVPSGPNPLHN
ncbi:hypothetical protein VNO77_39799 [Canavalia gladiata]|uniref:CLAVATA3/ESR (CLE)-related protein 9 n=1 Tax=Canavalia gladiata TaxID=3824 RepID=A0AAN9JZG3_CANGL